MDTLSPPVMLDLETWGTGNDAPIVSIGAVKFTADEITDRFHVGIDPGSSKPFGRDIDPDTIIWWLDPERDEARRNWLALEKVDLATALYGFGTWVGEPVPIWGNGSTFDNVILRSSYAAAGLNYPTKFWLDRCYRSVKALAPSIKLERIGTHHNALDDAESQARHLQAIVKHLGVELS